MRDDLRVQRFHCTNSVFSCYEYISSSFGFKQLELDCSTGQPVHHFCPDWRVSTSVKLPDPEFFTVELRFLVFTFQQSVAKTGSQWVCSNNFLWCSDIYYMIHLLPTSAMSVAIFQGYYPQKGSFKCRTLMVAINSGNLWKRCFPMDLFHSSHFG